MGIPFYFASLSKSHKGIIQAVKKQCPLNVDVLAVDFNCLIHRYLQDADPVKSVIDALQHIIENTCVPKQILIALDGLVPYAKIVQQRYRRMRVKEENTGTFDRNQISPDTPYMRDLADALRARFPLAIVSDTSEPGEGEHKMILMLQKLRPEQRQSICIYGLDADLILIALQHHALSKPHNMWLLRESAEFNDPKLKTAEFATLCIWNLLTQLPMDIEQYMALSILCFGNDFMPNLAMFSLREDGYDRALHMYAECGRPDLHTIKGCDTFLKFAASKEMEVLKERIYLRKRPEEKAMIGKDQSLFQHKFRLHILEGVTNTKPVVDSFWKTYWWTLAYFKTGEPTNWEWYYPYGDAPLVSMITGFKTDGFRPVENKKLNFTVTKQLHFILPAASIRSAKRRVVYPDELHSETRNTWMKRHDWEMKPRISLPWHPSHSLTSVELLTA
jgi:5'-3' exonuclease